MMEASKVVGREGQEIKEEVQGIKEEVQVIKEEAEVIKEEAEVIEEEARVSEEEAHVNKEQVKEDIARSVLRAFGLRPFHVFDGARYHVCFAAAEEPLQELNYGEELLDDFFSNCCRSPSTSNAHGSLKDVPTDPLLRPAAEDGPNTQAGEDDCLSVVPTSPKEVYYIMEEHYLSPSHTPKDTDHAVENDHVRENQRDPYRTRNGKEIHFIVEDNDLSPEELRLSICFPLLLSPPSPPKDTPMDDCRSPCAAGPLEGHISGAPCAAGPLEGHISGANIVEASTRSYAGKVKDDKGFRPRKKKVKGVEEYDASQSVRLDKPWAVKAAPRKKRATPKTGSKDPPEEEPPWNGLDVGDLEEQIGDSWVEDEKLRGLPEENPGDVVNPGQVRKSFWPTPLYGSPGRQVKVPNPLPETRNYSPSFAGSEEEENSEVEDFEESLEQRGKREEVALAKYALLFKDDQSWRKKFLDGLKLTCDICFSKRKIKKFSSVMSLLAHAKNVKKLRQPEHRGYAQAIRNLLHLDEPGNTPACHSVAGDQSCEIQGVWPPVVVVENTVIAVDLDGCFVVLNINELSQMLKALGDQGQRKLHPVVGANGLTGQVLVEFPTTHRGWIDAKHMHRQFELHARSYEDWLRLKPKFKGLLGDTSEMQESSGLLTVLEDNESVKRILYGYLATPHIIKHIDPTKQYVDWEVQNLKDFFDISDSDCSQAV